jgi:methionine biosynthesis protein MetW
MTHIAQSDARVAGGNEAFVRTLLGRSDYAIITDIILPGSKVLDLGCGDGELLEWLAEHKSVDARGVEISGARVQRAIARGVSVFQGDIEEALGDLPDGVFDYVILSQTLQETRAPLKVLREMLRVGRRAVVAFPNFGHWTVRLSHLWTGGAPKTKLFPHDWYDSPNIHFLTVNDFEALARKEHWSIERSIFLSGRHKVTGFPNLLAEVAVFLIASATV